MQEQKLKQSFSRVKKDIDFMRSSQQVLSKNVARTVEQFVTKDRLNMIKLRLTEIQQTIRNLTELESRIKAFEDKFITKTELKKQQLETSSELKRRDSEFNAKLRKLGADWKEELKVFVKRREMQRLLNKIGDELGILHEHVDSINDTKDQLKLTKLKATEHKLNSKLEYAAKEIAQLKKVANQSVRASQLKLLISDINSEFNYLKSNIDDIPKLKTYMNHIEKNNISVADFNKKLKFLNDEIEGLKNSILTLNKSKASHENLKKDIETSEDRLYDELDSYRGEFDKRLSKIEKGVDSFKKKAELKINNRIAKQQKQIAALKQKPAQRHRGAYMFANTLITLAFITLLASIGTFFFQYSVLTDQLAITSVVLFVIGLVTRVIVIAKRS